MLSYILFFWIVGTDVSAKIELPSHDACIAKATQLSKVTAINWVCVPKDK